VGSDRIEERHFNSRLGPCVKLDTKLAQTVELGESQPSLDKASLADDGPRDQDRGESRNISGAYGMRHAEVRAASRAKSASTRDTHRIERICDSLIERFGEPGRGAAGLLRRWLSGSVSYAYPEILEQHLDEKHLGLVFDAFRQILPFGTGGRRGLVGYGPNRMNPATLAMTVQGHCNYLLTSTPNRADLAVVVASDVRVFNDFGGVYGFLNKDHPLLGMSSRSLGRLACEIYAGNGITAYFQPSEIHQGLTTTPELSFYVRRLGTVGGIQLSASHNPPDDNGVKVYNQFGSQPIAPHDEQLAIHMRDVEIVRTLGFDAALKRGLVRPLPEHAHSAYVETYSRLYGALRDPDPAVPIVYTPLNGCGRTTVEAVLNRLGYVTLIPPGDEPDGTFSAVPLKTPNPEVSQATGPAKEFADKNGCGMVLSSDPDADRVGVDVKLADGRWHHFDGNQIAAILCHFLMLNPRGPRRRGLVLGTFVTTKLLGEIARKADSPVIEDLPVGMKYIANVLNELELNGRYGDISCSVDDLAFAAEESHGVVISPSVRDKDAAPACMYAACLYQMLRSEGRTLLDYYIDILREFGAYQTVNRSISMRGIEGTRHRDTIMSSLRVTPPKSLAGKQVRKFVDFWDEGKFGRFKGYTDKLSRDAVQIFTDRFIVAVRPSGTEPKLKFYCHMLPGKRTAALQGAKSLYALGREAGKVAALVYSELLARTGLALGPVGLLLPDIIDIDQKVRFERKTMPRLLKRATTATRAAGRTRQLADTLQWLRRETAAMTPGADPLPAIKGVLAHQSRQWSKNRALRSPALTELAKWAKS
jgi:phosphoglucomutase/phosphomannomutase